ncbi:MAG: hypothetical protein CVV44_00400 [Spirochaetae bacterium HGW-Spirochaetae-1]|jgi:opacity protein-like surface antigen|nr:MAG: hypothetical protein CVV44_00400 [Spirochaetae bacterium HGW-Spirochaetae-1]
MKKIIIFFSSLAILFTVSFASAQGVDVGMGLGISYPDEPDQVAFDSSFFADYNVNQYFSIGLETGFGWVKKDIDGPETSFGGLALQSGDSINYYTIPLLAVITINIPLGEEVPVVPFLSGGVGYSWTIYDPPSSIDWTFSGLTWQVMGGASYNLGENANGMKVFLEVGYRGTDIKKEFSGHDYELEMSGVIAHIGVAFPLSGGSDY